MVNCGTKLIFLVFPGIKDHLQQMSKSGNEYGIIERAIKVRIDNIFYLSFCGILLKTEYSVFTC